MWHSRIAPNLNTVSGLLFRKLPRRDTQVTTLDLGQAVKW